MTPKERVLAIISKMPDDSSFDQIARAVELVGRIQQGLEQLDASEVTGHEQAAKDIAEWLDK